MKLCRSRISRSTASTKPMIAEEPIPCASGVLVERVTTSVMDVLLIVRAHQHHVRARVLGYSRARNGRRAAVNRCSRSTTRSGFGRLGLEDSLADPCLWNPRRPWPRSRTRRVGDPGLTPGPYREQSRKYPVASRTLARYSAFA